MSLFRHFIRYVAVLSCGAFLVLAPHMAGQALAQPGEAHEQVGKTQRRVLDRAREGAHQEVIVVFDHTSTQQSIDALPASTAGGKTMGGTSQAAPHVSGALAVLRAAFPTESPEASVARLSKGKSITDASMNSSTLATYAQGKGYEVLTTLNPGDGFWVNKP